MTAARFVDVTDMMSVEAFLVNWGNLLAAVVESLPADPRVEFHVSLRCGVGDGVEGDACRIMTLDRVLHDGRPFVVPSR